MSSSAPLDARLGPRRRALVFAALCGLLFVASMLPRASYTVDDAFIYQRFARNALAGEGLVFNPGEAVEGYSSPLWMLLLWLGASLGAKGFVFARLLGIACTLAAVGSFAYLLARRCRPGLALGVGALFALSPGLAWWSGSGMDTPLVVLLMVFFVVGLFDDSPRWVLSAAALLAIARPEGPIFLVVAWAWIIGRARAGKLPPRRAWLAASAGAAPLLAWLVFRRISYGAWLANSAWAKLGRPATPSSADYGALEYWGEILMRAPASVIALAAGLVALRSMQDAELRRRLAWLGAPVLAGTAFLSFVGGDWMPWPRFWLHLLPAPFAPLRARRERPRSSDRAPTPCAARHGDARHLRRPSPRLLPRAQLARPLGAARAGRLAPLDRAAAAPARGHRRGTLRRDDAPSQRTR